MSASIDVYRSISVGTANPRHVIIKLYAAAVRSLEEAEQTLASGGNAAEPLHRTHMIVGGLMSALDFEAGELPRQLLNLYLFVLARLQETSTTGRDAGLAGARKVLSTLLSAWEAMPPETAHPSGRAFEAAGLNLRG